MVGAAASFLPIEVSLESWDDCVARLCQMRFGLGNDIVCLGNPTAPFQDFWKSATLPGKTFLQIRSARRPLVRARDEAVEAVQQRFYLSKASLCPAL